MSNRFDIIAQQLLQKSFSECTIADLQQLTGQYPYLAPAQFLLAKKLQLENSAEATTQWQKAALYHHQPAGFDAFLNYDGGIDFLELEEAADDTDEPEFADEEPLPFAINLPKIDKSLIEQPAAPAPEKGPEPEAQISAEDVLPQIETPAPQAPQPEPEVNAAPEPTPVAVPQPTPAPVAELPAFEPYHTIDYFASQGIKLSKEEATKDRMGRQLKSFTEWLKTMKKLPAAEQLSELDPHAEQKVEHMAAHSVAEAEIVTEAMAEVWLKQNNLEKAAEVYQKLSLSNPSKRAYFAAKLESLKKNV